METDWKYRSGVPKSNVSREAAKAAEEAPEELTTRRIKTRQLAILIDATHVGEVAAITAVGIDEAGAKRALGLSAGAPPAAETANRLCPHVAI